jgi:hypothetical protein
MPNNSSYLPSPVPALDPFVEESMPPRRVAPLESAPL